MRKSVPAIVVVAVVLAAVAPSSISVMRGMPFQEYPPSLSTAHPQKRTTAKTTIGTTPSSIKPNAARITLAFRRMTFSLVWIAWA